MAELNQNNIADIIDVEQRHYQAIKEILSSFLPYKKVIAYGSRVKWNASETSDLDLVVFNATDKQIYEVKEAFDESNIPFIIQILNWETIPQDFKENIEQKYHILQKKDDWGIFKLGEVADKIGDGLHGTPKYNIDGKYYFINGNNLKNGKITITNNTKNVDSVEFDKYKKELNSRTILLSINGTIGNLAKYNNELCILGKSAAYLNIKKDVDKGFIYYVMFDKSFQNEISYNANGSTIKNVSLAQLRNYQFYLPLLPEQKAIAEILSSLDDKIDLLHRQNKTLENLAETLFRHYFIDNAQDDWDSEEIGKYVTVVDNRGKTPPNQKEITPYPVIEVNALGKGDRLVDYSLIRKYVDKNTFENWFRAKPKKYDILVSTVGSIGEFSMFILEVGNIAQNVIALQAKEISPFYLYQVLKYKHEEVMNLDIGGVQPSIKVPHLLSIIISIPEIEIQKEFDIQIIEFVKKMETNYLQIQTLEKLRDTLLPKLISGEIRVNYKENE